MIRRARIPAALSVLTLFVYAAFPTRLFHWDGIGFARQIEQSGGDPGELIHANHLLYNFVGYALMEAAAAFGFHLRALWILQGMNIVLAALVVPLLYGLLRKEGAGQYTSACLSLLFAFSATWWRYAVDADSYIIPVLLLLGVWRLLRSEAVPAAVPALVHAAAMLFHQLAIFFFPAAVALLWRRGGARRRAVLVYGLVAGSITALAYSAAYRLLPRQRTGFLAWVTDRAPDAHFSFNPVHNAAMLGRSWLRLLLGGKLASFQPGALSIAGLILVAVALIFLVARTARVRGLARAWWSNVRSSEAAVPLLLWAGSYTLFLFFWLPQNAFYGLFYWPALVLLLGTGMGRSAAQRAGGGLAALAAFVFLWNFLFLTYPASRTEANEPLVFARAAQQRHWPPGTGVAFSTFHPDLWTIAYFNPQASWIGLEPGDTASVDGWLRRIEGSGSRLWLEATAYDALQATEAGRRWLNAHVRAEQAVIQQTAKRSFRFYPCDTSPAP